MSEPLAEFVVPVHLTYYDLDLLLSIVEIASGGLPSNMEADVPVLIGKLSAILGHYTATTGEV